MGLLGKLINLAADVVVDIPVAIVKDVVTGAGLATDQQTPYVVQAARKTVDDADEIRSEIKADV